MKAPMTSDPISPAQPDGRPAPCSRRQWAGFLGAATLVFALPAHAVDGVAAEPISLTRTYHGSDGSVLSMRAIGNTVVGFSQDNNGQRAYVFNGTRSGMTITGQVYGLPKGVSTQQGGLTLTLSNGGSTLQRVSGENVGSSTWIAKLPSQFNFPKAREAKFQSTHANDLDGAFKGSDGSRAYVRQYGSTVVTLTERFASDDDTRPVYATVGIATRSGDNLAGTFYDLPHQLGIQYTGPLSGQKSATARDFQLTMSTGIPGYPALRSPNYKADYAVDLVRFGQEIEDRLSPFVVGFSYAIAQNGVVLKKGAGGARRAPTADNGLLFPLAFNENTLNEVASTSKTVTLVAMLRLLRERNISVDSPVAPYLPLTWTKGDGMGTVTFRQLLSHGRKPEATNGLHYPPDCRDTSPYRCLRDAVAGGMTAEAKYNNIHYTIFRFILPFVLDPAGAHQLFLQPPLPWQQTEWENSINQTLSGAFRNYVRSMLLEVGVDADFKYVYGPGESGAYRYDWGTPPTGEIYPWIESSETHYLEAGSGGLKMTSKEFARFLSKLENGALLSAADLDTAKAIGFGGTGSTPGPNGVGPLWTKNGGADGTASQLMVFPGTEVFVTRNSRGNPAHTTNDMDMLKAAWQASLVGN
jgi:CubicO group peptidase (beta-lactamase class C family)